MNPCEWPSYQYILVTKHQVPVGVKAPILDKRTQIFMFLLGNILKILKGHSQDER